MAGLAGLLGGYGSDDDDEQEQQESGAPLLPGIPSAPSGSLSPAAAAAAAATAAGQQQDQQDPDQQQQGTQPPLRIIDGPSTNPEPPPEGLSPPLTRDPLDSNMGSEAGEELPAALYALPSELRDPPPGEPDPVVQEQLEKYLGWVRSGRSVVSELRKDRRWQNPKFLQKTVEYFGLQQYGTCLNPDVWDPAAIPEEDMWPALQQQLEAKKRRRGTEVKFQSSGQQLPPAGPGQAAAAQAAAAAAAAVALASHPGAAGGGAPKVVSIDPRAAAAQAQVLANSLAAGAKKSKWDK